MAQDKDPFAQFVTPAAPAAAPAAPAPAPAPAAQAAPENDPFAKFAPKTSDADPFAKFADANYKPPTENSIGKFARDMAVDLGAGLAVDIPSQIYGAANAATAGYLDPATRNLTGAVARGVTAAKNLFTGESAQGPTNAEAPSFAEGLHALDKSITGLHSDHRKALEAQRTAAVDKADGAWEETKAAVSETLSNPSLLAGDVMRSGASMFMPAMAGRMAVNKLGGTIAEQATREALERGATREAAQLAGQQAVDKLAERTVMGTTGLVQVGGGANIDTVNRTLQTEQGAMEDNPRYQELIAQGLSDGQARDELARKAGLTATAIAAPISMAASKITGAAGLLGQVSTGRYAGKGIADFAKAAGKEAAQEYPESFGETFAQNVAVGQYGDTSTQATKGAFAAGAMGALAGAAMGGGEHIIGSMTRTNPNDPNAPATAPGAPGAPGGPGAPGTTTAGAPGAPTPPGGPAAGPDGDPAGGPAAGPGAPGAPTAPGAPGRAGFDALALPKALANLMPPDRIPDLLAEDVNQPASWYMPQQVWQGLGFDNKATLGEVFARIAPSKAIDPMTPPGEAPVDDAPPAAPTGPLSSAVADVNDNMFPFGDSNLAQKQADALANKYKRPYEVIDHPTVAGRFAAVPKQEKKDDAKPNDLGTGVPESQLGADRPNGSLGLDGNAGNRPVGDEQSAAGPVGSAAEQDAAGAAGADGDNPASVAPTNVGAAKVTPESVTPKNPVDLAAHEATNSPLNERKPSSDPQNDADNYKLGRPDPKDIHGFKIGIENPKGSTRTGKDEDGKPWSTLMSAHYGRFTGTKGADGDAVDTFIGDKPESQRVFVIDQVNPRTGQFDEHKVILGADTPEEARQIYQDNYQAGWQGGKTITETTPDELKAWLKSDGTTKPFSPEFKPGDIEGDKLRGEIADAWTRRRLENVIKESGIPEGAKGKMRADLAALDQKSPPAERVDKSAHYSGTYLVGENEVSITYDPKYDNYNVTGTGPDGKAKREFFPGSLLNREKGPDARKLVATLFGDGNADSARRLSKAQIAERQKAPTAAPTGPTTSADRARFDALTAKRNEMGLDGDEARELEALDPSTPRGKPVADMARETGVPEEFLTKMKGFWDKDKQAFSASPELVRTSYEREEAENAVRRALGDFNRGLDAINEIVDAAQQDSANRGKDAIHYNKVITAKLLERAAEVSKDADTEGTFENLLRKKRDDAAWQQTTDAMHKANLDEIRANAQEIDRMTAEGLITPEEQQAIRLRLENAEDSLDAAMLTEEFVSQKEKLRDKTDQLKAQPAANEEAPAAGRDAITTEQDDGKPFSGAKGPAMWDSREPESRFQVLRGLGIGGKTAKEHQESMWSELPADLREQLAVYPPKEALDYRLHKEFDIDRSKVASALYDGNYSEQQLRNLVANSGSKEQAIKNIEIAGEYRLSKNAGQNYKDQQARLKEIEKLMDAPADKRDAITTGDNLIYNKDGQPFRAKPHAASEARKMGNGAEVVQAPGGKGWAIAPGTPESRARAESKRKTQNGHDLKEGDKIRYARNDGTGQADPNEVFVVTSVNGKDHGDGVMVLADHLDGRQGYAAYIDGVIKVDDEGKPLPAPSAEEKYPKAVGRREDGKMLYADERGVRFYTDSGVRIWEPVGIKPGGGIVINSTRRNEFLTADELAGDKPAEPKAEDKPPMPYYKEPKQGDTGPGEPSQKEFEDGQKAVLAAKFVRIDDRYYEVKGPQKASVSVELYFMHPKTGEREGIFAMPDRFALRDGKLAQVKHFGFGSPYEFNENVELLQAMPTKDDSPLLAALRKTDTAEAHIKQAAKELAEGDDTLVKDLIRISAESKAEAAKLAEEKAEFAWDMIEQTSQSLTDDDEIAKLQPLADQYKGDAAQARGEYSEAFKQLALIGKDKDFYQAQKKRADEIQTAVEKTADAVRAEIEKALGRKLESENEKASLARSAVFGERAATILKAVEAVRTEAALADVKQSLQKLAEDMEAVNDRFAKLVRAAVEEVNGTLPYNLDPKGATTEQRQAAKRAVITLQGVTNFGKNATAPEHANNKFKVHNPDEKYEPAATGSSIGQADIDESVVLLVENPEDFKEVVDEWAALFEQPGEKVIMDQRAKQAGFISQQEADAQLAAWKAHVEKQRKEHSAENSQKTILSLFDLSGEWSKPWKEAGYNVVTFDIQTGQDINDFTAEYFTDNYDLTDVYGILAAAPCTDFTSAANRFWNVKDADGRTEASKELVMQTLRTIEFFRPTFWALENPSGGRIEKVTGLPPPRLSFQPHHFGNAETKPTALFGKFSTDLPLANVKPNGSKTNKVGGKSIETKNERSETPEGFAYSFFMANNYIDLPAETRLVNEFPEASGAIKAALKVGMTEAEIRDTMQDLYEDLRPEQARTALVKEVAARSPKREKAGPRDAAALDPLIAEAQAQLTALQRQQKASDKPLDFAKKIHAAKSRLQQYEREKQAIEDKAKAEKAAEKVEKRDERLSRPRADGIEWKRDGALGKSTWTATINGREAEIAEAGPRSFFVSYGGKKVSSPELDSYGHAQPWRTVEAAMDAVYQYAQEAGADADMDLPNGQHSDVEHPMKFYSGMTRPGDFKRLFAEDRNVGIQVGELNGPTPYQIAEAMADSKGHLFVDSGAFPAYQSNMLAFLKALDAKEGFEDWKGEKVLSFEEILAKYELLANAIASTDDSGFATERTFFVMPDVIGRQKDSLDLVSQFKTQINAYGDRAIVPLQAGDMTLTQMYEASMISLMKDPDQDAGPIIGIPSAKEAAPNDQLTDLLKKHGDRIAGVHVLGLFAESTLKPRLDAIRAAGYSGNVTSDANRLRSLMYGGRTREDAWDMMVAETAAETGTGSSAKTEPEAAPAEAPAEKTMEQILAESAEYRRNSDFVEHHDTVIHFDNKRSGKEQFAYTIAVAALPKGGWTYGFQYKYGGNTDASFSGSHAPSKKGPHFDTRDDAIAGGLSALDDDRVKRQKAAGVEEVGGKIWNWINRGRQEYKDAKKAADEAASAKAVRVKKGFATPEQEEQRIRILRDLDKGRGDPKKLQGQLNKLPPGNLTQEGAVSLPQVAEGQRYVDLPEYQQKINSINYHLEGKTLADLDAVYAEIVHSAYDRIRLGVNVTREAVAEKLAAQDKASGAAKAAAKEAGKRSEAVNTILSEIRSTANAALREYVRIAPDFNLTAARGPQIDPFMNGKALSRLVAEVEKGESVEKAAQRAKTDVRWAMTEWNTGRTFKESRPFEFFEATIDRAAAQIKDAQDTGKLPALADGVVRSGEVLKTKSGKEITVPKFDGPPRPLIDVPNAAHWAKDLAVKESEGDETWLRWLSDSDPDKAGTGDWITIQNALFAGGYGGPKAKDRATPAPAAPVKADKPKAEKPAKAPKEAPKYGFAGRAALAKIAKTAGLKTDPTPGDLGDKDSLDLIEYFDKYYFAGREGKPMPAVEVHPDDARTAYGAGKKDAEKMAPAEPVPFPPTTPEPTATVTRDAVSKIVNDANRFKAYGEDNIMFRYTLDLIGHGLSQLKLPREEVDAIVKNAQVGVSGRLLKPADVIAVMESRGLFQVSDSTAPAPTPEQAIRDAFNALEQVTIGSWHPITVTSNGVTQHFLANQKKVDSSGQRDATIHLLHIKVGRMIAGSPQQYIANYYRLDSKNNLAEEGMPTAPTDGQISRWRSAGFPLAELEAPAPAPAPDQAPAGSNKRLADLQAQLANLRAERESKPEAQKWLVDTRIEKAEKALADYLAANPQPAEAAPAPQAAAKDDIDALLDDELKDALSDLGDVLGDVFGGRAKVMGPKRTAGELLPALSKVVDLLIKKGLRSFHAAISTAARAMRSNEKTAPHVDAISPRQWKAAYNAVAEMHEGTDPEGIVNGWSNEDIAALTADNTPKAPPADNNAADTQDEESNGQDNAGNEGPEALGDMAPGEDGGTEGGRGVRGGNSDRGQKGAGGNSGTDGAGVSGARGGRGGAADVHSPETGGTGRGRLGGKGAGRKGKGVPGNDEGPRVTPSAPNIPAQNFRITPELRLGQGGETEKFNDNLAAIRALKTIEAENRRATPAEQSLLARYVGWGGLANAFPNPETGKFLNPAWEKRGAELESLLSKKEYQLARRSTLDSHYTSETVVSAMWQAAERLGYQGGLALESSMGAGNFLGLIPEKMAGSTRFIGVEYDSLTSRIGGLLYPQETVLNSGFQSVPLPDSTFDLAIGNPPFGDQRLRFQFKPEFNGFSIHNQFFLAAIDAVKPGGLQIQVVSRYLLDAQDSGARTELAKRAKLLGAIRLPDTAFKENARTSVVTDIVFLQRLTADEEAKMEEAFAARSAKPEKDRNKEFERQALIATIPDWIRVDKINDPLGGEAMPTNAYFAANPRMILGTLERSGKMQFKNDITVRPNEATPLADQLAAAIARLPANVMQQEQTAIEASLERYANLADALQIALSGAEAGSIRLHNDGTLQQVIERETPTGDFELTRRTLTATSPWSESLLLDSKGRWYRNEVVLDAKGEAVKIVGRDGKPTKRNQYEKKIYADESTIPKGMLLGESKYARLRQMVEIRDALVAQLNLEAEDANPKAIEENRKLLADAYHAFVKEHGYISESANSALVANMPDGALVQALESSYRPEITAARAKKIGEKARPASAKPAPILSERVIVKYVPPTSAASLADAIAIQTAEAGVVDIERVASLLGKTEDETIADIEAAEHPLLFKDPEKQAWVTRNEYLSGAVKKKLAAAQSAGLDKNAAELQAVQPEPWGAESVTVLLGSTWVPPQVYADFVQHITGSPARVSFSRATNSYTVNAGPQVRANEEEWGSERITAARLIDDLLNSVATKITDTDMDGKTTVNQELTNLALLKSRAIANEFGDWVFANGERRKLLVDVFNEKFNTRVMRQHDGSHLVLPGKVPDEIIRMRRHQNNAIWRGITERFMLLDHAVGAGKTYTAIARAMERRRMGLSKKPLIVVPNHMVEQFTADAYRLYPGAKVLAAGKKDFERIRRRKLFAKIATGDYDIVIVPHSSFGFIDIAPETELRYLEGELKLAEEAIKEAQEEAAANGDDQGFRKPFGVKQAERLRDTITARMDKVKGNKARDKLLTFEQLGVDDMTVDEAHEFKNLFYSSRLTNVKGMGNKAGSQKAFDLYNKVRVLRESPKGTVTFMTGTPISNSAVEMYTMMRYLAADELSELGLEHFDSWRAQYVSSDAAWEPNETGRLKEVNRLGRTWSNMRSLMDLYYGFTDAVSNDDIKAAYREDHPGKEFPIPRVKGGDRQSVVIQPTPAQIALLETIIDGFDSLPDIDDPYERNIARLQLMDRARKVSLDVRAVDPFNESKEEGGKLEKIADEVKRLYTAFHADRGTQLIFLDRSVPKSKGDDKVIKAYDALRAEQEQALREGDEDTLRRVGEKLEAYDKDEIEALRRAQAGGWNAYQQIKDNLIARGIPAEEIRFVQEANNDEQKQALFDAVKDGLVRVLIGSTPRMGAGTNVQDRLVGLHHADVTWKPSDIEQREGRIIRQGNKINFDEKGNNIRPDFEVEILAYATERTIDAKMWNLNATKLRTINSIRKYDGAFSMDFEDEDSVSMAELAALASGDPLLLERVKLMSDIDRLELLKRQHARKNWGIVSQIEDAERILEQAPKRIERAKADHAMVGEAYDAMNKRSSERTVDVEGKAYRHYPEAAAAAKEAMDAQQAGDAEAKFSVKVNGKRFTSSAGMLDGIQAALGDLDTFEMEVEGEAFISRTDAARKMAEKADAVSKELNKEGEDDETFDIGTLMGFKVEMTVQHSKYWGYGTELAVLRPDGSTLASYNTTYQKEPGFTTSRMRTAVEGLAKRVKPWEFKTWDYDLHKIEEAKAALPELLPKRDQPFPQQDELDKAMGRLEEVIRLLSSGPVAKPVSRAAEVAQSGMMAERQAPLPPVFSLGANTGDVAAGADVDMPVSHADADRVVRRVIAGFQARFGRNLPVGIKLVPSIYALPPAIRDTMANQGAEGALGAFYDNTVYVVRSAHRSAREVEETIFHELYGHAAMRTLFGKDWVKRESELYDAIGRDEGLKKFGAQYGMDVRAYFEGIGSDATYSEDMRKAILVEEVLAHMAQARGSWKMKFKAFMGAVRAWLRDHGFARLSNYNDTDLAHLLQKGSQALARVPANADKNTVVFSRGGESFQAMTDLIRSGATLGKITGHVKEVFKSYKAFNNFNLYDKTLSTQYNKARKDADFRAVFEPAMQQIDDTAHFAIEAEREAPDVLVRIEGPGEIWNALRKGGPQYAADMKAIAKPLFDNIEGQQGIRQFLFSPEELRRDYGLTENQIELYQQVRRAVDTSIDRLAQTTIMAMGQAQGMNVADLKGQELDDTIASVKEGILQAHEDAQLRAEAEANLRGDMPPAPVSALPLIERIDKIAETASMLKMRGYMPAMRFGHYAVTVRDPNAEPGTPPVYFNTYESQFAAHAAAARLGREFAGMTVEKSVMNDEQYKMFKGVSPETVELFAKFSGLDTSQAVKDYIALAKASRSARLHELNRQGVAGFSEDVSRVVSSFLLSNARQSAIYVNAKNIDDALASRALARKGDVQKEAKALVDYMNNPAEEAQGIRQFMFMYYIGGSVASALTNLTQPMLQTLPWLTEFVGRKAGALVLSSAKMAATGNITDERLRHALKKADTDGLTKPKEIHALMADADAGVIGSNLRVRALKEAWGGFFGQAEAFNRRLTFLAAYSAALDMGHATLREKGYTDAYDFARRALTETQGLYAKINRPNWGRNAIGATLLTFKQFSITYLEMLVRMPWEQKAIALALLTLAAGVEGWPFMENLQDIIDTLGQSMGYNTNSKKTMRKLATDALGESLGHVLLHGVTGLTGADLSGRIGLGRMLPGTDMFKMSDQRASNRSPEALGAFGSLVYSARDALMQAQLGNPVGAVRAVLPTAVRNAVAGVEMSVTGNYHDTAGRNVMPVSQYEAALKFFGFQPDSVARQSDIVGDISQDKAMMGSVKSSIVKRWAAAIVHQDQDKLQETIGKWQEWNQSNPGSKIAISPAEVRTQVMNMTMDRAQRTIKTAPRSMRGEAAEELSNP